MLLPTKAGCLPVAAMFVFDTQIINRDRASGKPLSAFIEEI